MVTASTSLFQPSRLLILPSVPIHRFSMFVVAGTYLIRPLLQLGYLGEAVISSNFYFSQDSSGRSKNTKMIPNLFTETDFFLYTDPKLRESRIHRETKFVGYHSA